MTPASLASWVPRRSGQRSGPALRTTARLAAGLVLAALVLAALTPQVASARTNCVTILPVNVMMPDGPFAAAYTRSIRVQLKSRGLRVRNVRAELYTFSGRRMGASMGRRTVRGTATLTLRLEREFAPIQAGAFTLVLTGEPNAARSCGPKTTTRVLRFRPCRQALPIAFPKLPAGSAADYEGYLSIPVRSRGPLIRDVTSSVYGFDGSLLGRVFALRALFGEAVLDHALLRALVPGRYTVVVEGLLDEQPRSCGRKRAQATMTFG